MILFDRVYEKHNFLLKKKSDGGTATAEQISGGGKKDKWVGNGLYVCMYIHTFYLSTAPDFLIMSHITPEKKTCGSYGC